MGDPAKQRKKWKAPRHPWIADRITSETQLVKEYGLKNKREIWKSQAILRNWRERAKKVVALLGEQKELSEKVLLDKLTQLGILDEAADVDRVLGITLTQVMDRRLQTILYKKGLATTMNQARQFIVHNKVVINGERINSPSYFVKSTDDVRLIPGFSAPVIKLIEKEQVPEESTPSEKTNKQEVTNNG